MTRVLFVCVHNAGRSQMAEAFLNAMARESGAPVEAQSAGTVSGKELNPMAVAALAELGISMEGHAPKLLTQPMADAADITISMGCGVDAEACPAKFLLTEDWELEDPAGQGLESVRGIRDQIQTRCRELLDRIAEPSS
jgi:arsenate reductase